MPKWPEDVILYSASAFKDVKQCPARLFFKKEARLGRIKEDISYGAIFGSAIHQGIEERLKYERNPFVVSDMYLQRELLDKYDAKEIDAVKFAEKQAVATRCLTNFEQRYRGDLMTALDDPLSQVEVGLEIPWRKGWFVGKIDVAQPEIFGDWKTSPSRPKEFELHKDIQHQVYFYLAAKSGLVVPKRFVYVYLYGFNEARTIKVIERGPNKGEERVVEDKENPKWKFDFDVKPTVQSANDTVINQLVPLAKIIEENIVYKNPSNYNCSSCKYKTVCPEYKLPTIQPEEHNLLIKEETAA